MESIDLLKRRIELQTAMNGIGPMRSGSLTVRYIKCGKAQCNCKSKDHPGHGPTYSYSVKDEATNKTVIQYYHPGQRLQKLKEEIDNYHLYKRLQKEYINLNNEICKATETQEQEREEKQALKKNSSKKSDCLPVMK
jgi:hypothetical protein